MRRRPLPSVAEATRAASVVTMTLLAVALIVVASAGPAGAAKPAAATSLPSRQKVRQAPCAEGEKKGYVEVAKGYIAEGRIDDAAACIIQQVEILDNPEDQAALLHELGATWTNALRFAEASEVYHRALMIDGVSPATRAGTLIAVGQMEFLRGDLQASLESLREADRLTPGNLQIITQAGIMQELLGMDMEALDHFNLAVKIREDLSVGWAFMARIFIKYGRFAEAETHARKAVAHEGDNPFSHVILAEALIGRRQYKSALRSLSKALSMDPNAEKVKAMMVLVKRLSLDWGSSSEDTQVLQKILNNQLEVTKKAKTKQSDSPGVILRRAQDAVNVFPFEHLPLFSGLSTRVAQKYAQLSGQIVWDTMGYLRAALEKERSQRSLDTTGKIRVGILSGDLADSSASARELQVALSLFPKSDFEVLLYAIGPPAALSEAVAKSMTPHVHHFANMTESSVTTVARRIFDDDVHILFAVGRSTLLPIILSARPAPVQASLFGSCYSIGTACIDYTLCDEIACSEYLQGKQFAESPVLFPHTLSSSLSLAVGKQPSKEKRRDARQALLGSPGREQVSAADPAFVYCSAADISAVDLETWDSWVEILSHTPGSVLAYFQEDGAGANITSLAKKSASTKSRVKSLPRPRALDELGMSMAQVCDLYLETATPDSADGALVALSAGVPVVARKGDTRCSLGTVSMLVSAGLADLVAPTAKSYQSIAEAYGKGKKNIEKIRSLLQKSLGARSLPFFDSRLSSALLQRSIHTLWERYTSGQVPSEVRIEVTLEEVEQPQGAAKGALQLAEGGGLRTPPLLHYKDEVVDDILEEGNSLPLASSSGGGVIPEGYSLMRVDKDEDREEGGEEAEDQDSPASRQGLRAEGAHKYFRQAQLDADGDDYDIIPRGRH